MDDKTAQSAGRNPYQLARDEEFETFARGVIDEALGKTATSPRQFEYYSMMAAKRIVQWVLERYQKRNA